MTARAVVLEQLATLALDATVIPYGRALDNVSENTLMVRVDSVAKGQGIVWRTYSVALLLIVPFEDPQRGEDELDALLEDVLFELEKSTTPLVWTSAQRAVFQEKWPCYEVTLSVPTSKEQA